MFKKKTIRNFSLLRIAALLAIVSFSFEITSDFFIQDDFQIEIVDIDLEDDAQDEEFDSSDLHITIEPVEFIDDSSSKSQLFHWPLKDQHLAELSTPPPDFT